ncbi:MAG: hypothetical protein WD801_06795 [Gemmatimonadaceae bacterium]
MRALLVVTVLALGAATVAGAQVPAGPEVPSAAKPQRSGGELRVSGFMINGDRSYEFFNDVNTQTGSVRGVDVLLRHTAIGIGVRSWTSTYGTQPNVASADARLYLFPPVFSIMLGAGRRAVWSDLNEDAPSQLDFGLVGISSTVAIGGSGLRTNVSGAMMIGAPDAASDSDPSAGLEGEASILYRIPKVPIFLQLGYRTELFTARNSTFETPQEARGVRLGAGLQFGGR